MHKPNYNKHIEISNTVSIPNYIEDLEFIDQEKAFIILYNPISFKPIYFYTKNSFIHTIYNRSELIMDLYSDLFSLSVLFDD
jgi:hypothetical protein